MAIINGHDRQVESALFGGRAKGRTVRDVIYEGEIHKVIDNGQIVSSTDWTKAYQLSTNKLFGFIKSYGPSTYGHDEPYLLDTFINAHI